MVGTTTDNTITSPKENMTPADEKTTADTYTKGLSFDIMFTSLILFFTPLMHINNFNNLLLITF